LITESKDCHFIEFLYALDNRFNEESFTAGLIANIIMQIALPIGYQVGMYYTYNDAYFYLYYLYENTAFVRVVNELYDAYYAGDIE
jgi:small basic protein